MAATRKVCKGIVKDFCIVTKNTNVDSVEKIERIIKITIETTLKLWQGPRQ